MKKFRLRSTVDQVVDSLREELRGETWRDTMPGATALSRDLEVNHKTVEAALNQLEREGLLKRQGPGLPRLIVTAGKSIPVATLRIGVLLFDDDYANFPHYNEIRQKLLDAGHSVLFSPRTMTSLQENRERIAKMVEQCSVDAWIVTSANHNLLEWFEKQPLPVFALAGNFAGLKVPGISVDAIPVMRETVNRLVQFGHQRIVYYSRQGKRKPEPGLYISKFFDELEQHGLTTSSYNIPDWEESARGFHSSLESLFNVTPPTAVILDEAVFVGPFLQFCAQKGLTVPGDISLFCNESNLSFDWFEPPMSHLAFNSRIFIQRIVRWADNVNLGKDDFSQSLTEAKFIEGGTIGPLRRD